MSLEMSSLDSLIRLKAEGVQRIEELAVREADQANGEGVKKNASAAG